MIIKFTDKQVDYLIHRPEDCIAEVLHHEFLGEDIHLEAGRLSIQIEKTKKIETKGLTDLQKAILKEMIEGSTYHCAFIAEFSDIPAKTLTTIRTTAKKLETIDGIENINIPYY